MVGLLIANLLALVVLIGTIIMAEHKIEQAFDESLCEMMTAVFNADSVKERCKEAAENGEGYVEI